MSRCNIYLDESGDLGFKFDAPYRAGGSSRYFASITVYKQRVIPHIQADPNKLYNYMTGLLLLPIMKRSDQVFFVPDARSIKVKSGNSLHDYLQTKLWFDEGVATALQTIPSDSAKTRPLHFTDFLCGVFQPSFEDGAIEPRNALEPVTSCQRLFFPTENRA